MTDHGLGGARFLFDIDAKVHRARSGEPESAQELLAYVCIQVEKQQPVDRAVMEYLAEAFREALSQPGCDPRKALGLQRRRAGNPGGRPIKRAMTAEAHEELRQDVRTRVLDGQTDSQIKKDLAPAFGDPRRGISADSVRSVVREEKRRLEVVRRLIAQTAMELDTDQQTARKILLRLLSE